MVRMGECAASRSAGDVLVSIGLGSCIGLALVDAAVGVGGLAHIMLPETPKSEVGTAPARYADTAVDLLLERVLSLGAVRRRVEAVLVGGAKMFAFGEDGGSRLDIGARNESSTRQALARCGIPISGGATSGSRGRTIRVVVESGVVTVREAGGRDEALLGSAASA